MRRKIITLAAMLVMLFGLILAAGIIKRNEANAEEANPSEWETVHINHKLAGTFTPNSDTISKLTLARPSARIENGNIIVSLTFLKAYYTDKEYEQQSQQVGIKIDQLLMRKEEILSEQGKVQLASYRIEEVTKLLQTGKILEEFDRVMFKSLVRKITVLSNKEIEIEFECGITVRETL